MKCRGFSMLELMVVVAIIAILAMLAVPSQFGKITQQRLVETIELIEPYQDKIALYYRNSNGGFPPNNAAAGLPEPHKIRGNYLRKLEVRDGVLHLYLGQNLPESLHGKIVSIRPVYVHDSPQSPISWICGHAKVPTGMRAAGRNLTDIEKAFLPGRCRF